MTLASLDIIDMEPYTGWLCGEKDLESFLSSLKSIWRWLTRPVSEGLSILTNLFITVTALGMNWQYIKEQWG